MEQLGPGDPRQVAQYRISARLGAGGMGQVYLARSPGGRSVAVKVVRADLAQDPQFRIRFAREVEAAKRVSGVFTAPVIDADPNADPPWLATGYVPGPSLTSAVTEFGPLPEDSVRMLVAGLAEALVAIHRAGLVHRDLKPSNVLLALDGPKVIDFGIAKALESVGLTMAGSAIGSPGFMAPEQVTGGEVTFATDIFALGAVLVFAATGRSPFGTGPTPALLYRVVNDEVEVDDLPGGLRPLARSCLAKNPWERPSAAQILDGLDSPDQAPTAAFASGGRWLPAPLTRAILRQSGMLDEERTVLDPPPAPTAPLTAPAPSGYGYPGPAEGSGRAEGAGPPAGFGPPPFVPASGGTGYNGPGSHSAYSTVPAPQAPQHPGVQRPPKRRRAILAVAVAVLLIGGGVAIALNQLGNKDDTGGDSKASGAPSTASPAPDGPATALPCGGINDPFTSNVSAAGWHPINKMEDTIALPGGKLDITAADGADLRADIPSIGARAPMFYREVNGNFTAETEVNASPHYTYQGAGLFLSAADFGYIRLERGYGDTGGITFEYFRDDGKYVTVDYAFTTAAAKGRTLVRTDATSLQLRLRRAGDTVTASWRASGAADWQQLGQAPTPGTSGGKGTPELRIGLSVVNRAQSPQGDPQKRPFTASFDHANITCG
ncbi:protein kinase [Streptomyces sp. So13.3]|uniref:protein kinase domain-containing protein n=1 Tax=Streptomyces TaxID=1883 RepID=UPI001106A38E|nr:MULTISPECIES: protein kinase [Streptomyces]MCZ4102809.1 protein kinase [Streptomyces sp. H39-C1]QNA76868.1 protein kinase [Streptomyces sp. So13.3]